jgi:hypothetical protein
MALFLSIITLYATARCAAKKPSEPPCRAKALAQSLRMLFTNRTQRVKAFCQRPFF